MLVPHLGMRRLGLLLAVAGLMACAGPMRELKPHLQGWVGVDEGALKGRLGPPTDTATLSNGDRILTWRSDRVSRSGFTCTLDFRVDPQGRITWARASGNADRCWNVLCRGADYAGADETTTRVQ